MQSRKFNSALIGSIVAGAVQLIALVAIGFGVPEDLANGTANVISSIIAGLFGLHIVGTAIEDYGEKRAGAVRTEPRSVERDPDRKPVEGQTIQRDPSGKLPGSIGSLMGLLLLATVGLTAMVGCDPAADRKVERHLYTVVADLKTRGQMERRAITKQFNDYRTQKHRTVSENREEAMKALQLAGRLDATTAQQCADKFAAIHAELDRRVDLAVAIALRTCDWYDQAADTIVAAVDYYQARDQALVEFTKGALEGFTTSYLAAREESPSETDSRARKLLDQIQSDLVNMLNVRLESTLAGQQIPTN